MKILLATEGSEFSKAATEECCKMFGCVGDTQIRIVSAAAPTYVATEPFAISAEYVNEINAATKTQAESAVADAEAGIRKSVTNLATQLTTVVITGDPAQAIVEEAEKWGADLIIMGSHGYGFWQRALLGSVSNSVVHHAPCSVLIVRKLEKLNGKDN